MKKIFTLLIIAMVAVSFINKANATTCAGAASIPATPTFPWVSSLTCGTTNDITSANSTTCGNSSYKGGWEAVYAWTPAGNYINVSFAYSGQTWTGLFLYEGCPTSGGICIGNFTSSGSSKTLAYVGTNLTSGTKISLTSGVTYYFVIDTYPTPNSPCPGTITINGTLNLACEGTPNPGNTIATPGMACPGVNFTLSLQNATPGSGVTYQWQSSPDGLDPWTNFGALTASVTTSQLAATWYRCQVTCSGNTGNSNPVQVTMNSWINCYCLPTYSSGGSTDGMTLVTLGPLSQATVGNVSPYYYDYTTTQNAIPDLSQGTSANLMITFGSDGNQYNGVWIDFDHSSSFEITEFFTSGTNAGASGTATVVLTVPLGANLGNTRMRIRGGNDSQLVNTQACGVSSSNYGQAHDYFVNITLPPPPGYLSGIVTDQTTSLPLGGVEVVTSPGGATATTDPSGWYEIELEQGTYAATFSKADYLTQTNSGQAIASGATTTLNVVLGPIPPPYCADLVSPADDATGLLPGISLNWEPSAGSSPVLGYRIQLFNLTNEVWLEGDEIIGTDLGNVTSYTPAEPFEWGCSFVWLIIPYNNAGTATECTPWYFTVTSFGNINGLVKNTSTGLPVEGAKVDILQTFPNTGYTFNALSGSDGKWNLQLPVGIFKLTYSKFGYFTKTINNVSVFANQTTNQTATLDPVTPYSLPFAENWSTGSFNTQKWSVNPALSNWSVSAAGGNPAPAARFYWGPEALNYQSTLTSYNLNGVGASKVYAQFDLFLQNYDWSTYETMTFMVFDGAQWNDIETFDNQGGDDGSIPWTTLTYDITQYAAGHQFLLGFKAEGENSFNIDWWFIDNILVTTSIMEVSPPSIADALFAGETSQFPVTIQNNGNRSLFWSAEVVPPSPWVTLSASSGVTPVGSEIINVTLDAGVLVPGVYEAQLIITAGGGTLQHTTSISLKVFEGAGQKIKIPEPNSWGYISSYINIPVKAPLEDVLSDIADEMVIMLGDSGIFWPVQGINTIGDWNSAEGYKLKMGGDGALIIPGMPVTNKIAHFTQGTHIIPVLSTGQIATAVIFNNKPVVFAFSLDGKIYWPAGGITDLKYLVPGYGYLVKFSAPCDLNFGGTKGEEIPYVAPVYANNTTWNNVSRTGDVHIIGVSAEATAELVPGDVLGAFNLDGLCVGMAEYSGNGEPFAIVTYADDNTTTNNDGMNVGELITIKAFRNGEEVLLNPVYNAAMPNADGLFAINGLSQITNFKESSLAVGGKVMDNIKIYPNPTSGIFNINLTGISNPIGISVTNSQGQLIYSGQISGSQQLDLTDQPNGVYFIRLVNENSVRLEKLIIK